MDRLLAAEPRPDGIFVPDDQITCFLYAELRKRSIEPGKDIVRLSDDPSAGLHDDGIAVGEFPIDGFPTRRRQPTDTRVREGYLGMVDDITRPYQIPFRIMLPERVRGLIVPVANGQWMMSRRPYDYASSGVDFLVGGTKSGSPHEVLLGIEWLESRMLDFSGIYSCVE